MPPAPSQRPPNARQSPYKRPADKVTTPTKKDSALASSPAPESCISPPVKPYVFNFGKHRKAPAKTLSEVPDTYISWLVAQIRNGGFSESRYDDLRAALKEDGYLQPDTISGPLREDWKPPALRLAPNIFVESVTGDPLWISEVDVAIYFSLSKQDLKTLPGLSGGGGGMLGNAKNKYFLFHVYDLVKTHASRAIADKALARFLEKNEQREWEIYGMLGLGACCDCNWDDLS